MEQSMYSVFVSTLRDPTPSPEDVAVTKAIVESGKLLDVAVLDHLIIGRGRYVSLKAKGLGF
jgi:DNA repair protein RadC